MLKRIIARYAGKCRICGDTIPSGSPAYWLGKGKGMQHVSCNAQQEPSRAKPETEGITSNVVDFAELRQMFLASVDSSTILTGVNARTLGNLSERWKGDDESRWFGSTLQEMRDWLAGGFTVEGLEGLDTSLIQAAPKRRLRYAEEGDELIMEKALMGDDDPFLVHERKPGKPGLAVEIHLCFNCDVSAKLVAEYARFIARMLQTFEENRVNTEITVINTVTDLRPGEYSGAKYEARTIVKRAGEASDFASWSALFAPSGFRMLGFRGIVEIGNKHGFEVSSGLGSAIVARSFDIEYDDEQNLMRIRNASYGPFPEYDMTEKLRAVIQKVSGQ